MRNDYTKVNLFANVLAYFKRDFHPNDNDNYYLANDFFAENREYFEEMLVAD